MMDGGIKQKELWFHPIHFSFFVVGTWPGKEETETKQDPVELVGQILSVSHFLFVGNRLYLASLTWSWSSKGQVQIVINHGREGVQRQGRNSQERVLLWAGFWCHPGEYVIYTHWGEYYYIPKEVYNNTSELFCRPKALIQVEDDNFRLSTGFLGYFSTTLPPANQKKVTHTAPHTPHPTFCL